MARCSNCGKRLGFFSRRHEVFSDDGRSVTKVCGGCYRARSRDDGSKTQGHVSAVAEGETTEASKPATGLLPLPNARLTYTCECGLWNKFDCRFLDVATGGKVTCGSCGAVVFVPPDIFDHKTYWREKEGAALCSDWQQKLSYVRHGRKRPPADSAKPMNAETGGREASSLKPVLVIIRSEGQPLRDDNVLSRILSMQEVQRYVGYQDCRVIALGTPPGLKQQLDAMLGPTDPKLEQSMGGIALRERHAPDYKGDMFGCTVTDPTTGVNYEVVVCHP
jgi:hypothetical protein